MDITKGTFMGVQERRALEKQVRRNQILDAARKLMLSSGFDKISISKISKEAQLGVGTIYFYYKNKDEIFIALQEEGLSFLFTVIEQISNQEIPADEKIRKIADAYYDFRYNQEEYYHIINYFLSSPKVFFPEAQKNQIDMSGSKILVIIEQIVKVGIETNLFEEADPKKFSIMLWGTLHGLIQFKKLENTTLQQEDLQEIYKYSVEKLITSIQK
jgi:AcrR family transcriptional regulator